MIRRLAAVCLSLSLLAGLPGCRTPGWTDPVNPWKHDAMDRGQAALQAKDYVMALHFYGEVVADEPDNMQAHYQLARVNQDLDRHEEAYRFYRIVYVSGSEEPALLPNGDKSEEPLFRAAEKQLRLLRARLGKAEERVESMKPEQK